MATMNREQMTDRPTLQGAMCCHCLNWRNKKDLNPLGDGTWENVCLSCIDKERVQLACYWMTGRRR